MVLEKAILPNLVLLFYVLCVENIKVFNLDLYLDGLPTQRMLRVGAICAGLDRHDVLIHLEERGLVLRLSIVSDATLAGRLLLARVQEICHRLVGHPTFS